MRIEAEGFSPDDDIPNEKADLYIRTSLVFLKVLKMYMEEKCPWIPEEEVNQLILDDVMLGFNTDGSMDIISQTLSEEEHFSFQDFKGYYREHIQTLNKIVQASIDKHNREKAILN
jgi:hypothetical protein